VFHIGIDIDGTATDCVLIDQAAPDAAVTYQMARALPVKDRPADLVMAGLAELAQTVGLGQQELLARTTQFCQGTGGRGRVAAA
jgi:N-methylhydantoinase A/oxoprolinase/acetone carboxylase beta subunit